MMLFLLILCRVVGQKKSRLMLLCEFSAPLAEIILLFVDVPSWGVGEVVECLV